MNPVLKRPEVWVLAVLTIAGAIFVIQSQSSLEEELTKSPVKIKTPEKGPETSDLRFDVESVHRREVGGVVEVEISGTLKNDGTKEIVLADDVRLKVGDASEAPLFLASNPAGSVDSGQQRKVLLPFTLEKSAAGEELNLANAVLAIGDYEAQLDRVKTAP